jgi:dTMP kinase
MTKGLFITFEGIEGSGKSTQCKLLQNHLNDLGIETVLSFEPGGTKIGQKLRAIILDDKSKNITPETELLLYMADRSHHLHSLIKPTLAEGKFVILDRYHDSSVAYQQYGRGVKKEVLDFLFHKVIKGLTPDITFLIDISVETSMNRILKREIENKGATNRFEREKKDFHKRIRQGFLEIASREKRFFVVDGEKEVQEVFKQITKYLDKFIKG